MNISQHLSRIMHATGYAIAGLKVIWQRETSFRQEIYICVIALPLLYFLSVSPLLKLLLVLLLILVLVVETINTAIETTIDRISLVHHTESKTAKDLGSTAVLLTILMNVMAWIYVLFFAASI